MSVATGLLPTWNFPQKNCGPAYFSGASDAWQHAENFTADKTANKITFRTGHLSDWSLIATQIGDEAVPGDMNNGGITDLADVIAVLRVCVEASAEVSDAADVSGDGRIRLADAVHVLREIAR